MKLTINQITEKLNEINYSNTEQAARWIYDFYGGGAKLTKRSFQELIDRLSANEPLQYIFGEWDFYGMTFKVGKGVLCPRPESELLVEIATEHMKTYSGETNPSIFDLCAGSGCLGIAIQHNYPAETSMILVENSEFACKYLMKNIRKHYPKYSVGKKLLTGTDPDYYNIQVEQMNEDVLVFAKDMGVDRETAMDINCYLIVSNPPYLTYDEAKNATKSDSTLFYEPLKALYGGRDGNDFYPVIIEDYSPFLIDGGMMLFEVGSDSQANFVADRMKKCFRDVKIHKDLSGNSRAVSGIK